MPIGYKNFFSSSNYSGVCGACSWDVKTLPRSPSWRGAVEMFCLVDASRVQESVVCRRLGRFGQAFFRLRPLLFVARLCALRARSFFGAQLQVAPHQLLAYDSRFSNYVSRYRGCGRGARSKRDAGTNHTRNCERLRERERSARNVAKIKELASSRFNVLTLRPFNDSLRPQEHGCVVGRRS